MVKVKISGKTEILEKYLKVIFSEYEIVKEGEADIQFECEDFKFFEDGKTLCLPEGIAYWTETKENQAELANMLKLFATNMTIEETINES